MAVDLDQLVEELKASGNAIAMQAFRQAVLSVEGVAADLVPVGFYGRSRGKSGKSGGDLKQSLRSEITASADELKARFSSALPYAAAQHYDEKYHPGIYTGAPGDKYKSLYFERAIQIVFGEGDPLGRYAGKAVTFKEILADLQK